VRSSPSSRRADRFHTLQAGSSIIGLLLGHRSQLAEQCKEGDGASGKRVSPSPIEIDRSAGRAARRADGIDARQVRARARAGRGDLGRSRSLAGTYYVSAGTGQTIDRRARGPGFPTARFRRTRRCNQRQPAAVAGR